MLVDVFNNMVKDLIVDRSDRGSDILYNADYVELLRVPKYFKMTDDQIKYMHVMMKSRYEDGKRQGWDDHIGALQAIMVPYSR